jgi:integrase
MWCDARGKTLCDVKIEDVTAYKRFLLDPQPAEEWVGPSCPRFIEGAPNPNWRAFAGPLAPDSAKLTATILYNLFEFLVAADYLRANPWRLAARTRMSRSTRIDRFLEYEARDALFALVRDMAVSSDPHKRKHGVRSYWIVTAFYLVGARRSELANARMAHLYRDRVGWWWRITGKGNKTEDMPVTYEFLEVLKQYRLLHGMTALPTPDETSVPLVGDVFTGRRPISDSAVYKIIKELCQRAAETVDDPFMKDLLMRASPHWLRHTAASDQLNVAKLNIAMTAKNMRHADISTTGRYTHASREEQFEATQHHVLPTGGE